MSSYYIEILAIQSSPFSYGVDVKNRTILSCNYSARALAPVMDVEMDIYSILLANSKIATEDTFLGPNVNLPDSDEAHDLPYTLIINTGGRAPDESHDSKYLNLSFAINVRAIDPEIASIRAGNIFNFLDGRRSVMV